MAQTDFPWMRPLLEILGGYFKEFYRRGDDPDFPRLLGSASSPTRGSYGEVFRARLPCLPLFSRPGGAEAHAWAQETLISGDSAG
jgi:hypothetical protein